MKNSIKMMVCVNGVDGEHRKRFQKHFWVYKPNNKKKRFLMNGILQPIDNLEKAERVFLISGLKYVMHELIHNIEIETCIHNMKQFDRYMQILEILMPYVTYEYEREAIELYFEKGIVC